MLVVLRRQWITCSFWKINFFKISYFMGQKTITCMLEHCLCILSFLLVFYIFTGLYFRRGWAVVRIVQFIFYWWITGTLHLANVNYFIWLISLHYYSCGRWMFCETVDSHPLHFERIASFCLFRLVPSRHGYISLLSTLEKKN